MSIRNVAIIFDNLIRPDTTGGYCLAALRASVHVEHFLPSQLRDVPRGKFDLYLSIDDGLDYDLPSGLGRTALWAIDTHLNPERIVRRARWADAVFAAQRNGAELLAARLGRPVPWLPLACDPDVHWRHDVAKAADVAFVGNVNCRERGTLLQTVRERFPNTVVAQQRYGDEMARTYSASRVVFNRSVRDDVNMRVFEALACGSLLVTNDLDHNGQSTLFENGTHLATYRSADELTEQIAFYLAHEDLREKVAATGRAEVLARHTYAHRMRQLLATVEGTDATVTDGLGQFGGPSDTVTPATSGPVLVPTSAAQEAGRQRPAGYGEPRVGCVLALKDRPAEYLERALQTHAYQSVRPADRVVVDYGSGASLGRQYASTCRAYGWRYLRVVPGRESYSAAAACNIGIARMDPRVDVVFRSDVDILLGPGALDAARRLGADRFVVFRGIRSGPRDADYPPAFRSAEQLESLFRSRPFLDSMEGDGVAAFPREWFMGVGGYDLNFEGWGFEDSDLRGRAERSIGVLARARPLLMHQWHPRAVSRPTAMANYAYFQRMAAEENLVRNGGLLVRAGWESRIVEDSADLTAPTGDQRRRVASG